MIFRALPHSPQTYLVLHWTAASASCTLWAAPLSSFSLWASWPEGAGRSFSPAWDPLSLSVEGEMSIMLVCANSAALCEETKNKYENVVILKQMSHEMKPVVTSVTAVYHCLVESPFSHLLVSKSFQLQ